MTAQTPNKPSWRRRQRQSAKHYHRLPNHNLPHLLITAVCALVFLAIAASADNQLPAMARRDTLKGNDDAITRRDLVQRKKNKPTTKKRTVGGGGGGVSNAMAGEDDGGINRQHQQQPR